MHADGRNLKKPALSKTVTGTHVTVRVDDDANPAFWLDLRLTRGDLRAALDELDALAAAADTVLIDPAAQPVGA